MNRTAEVRLSKYLSYILRHKPSELNLTLDKEGYVSIEDLLGSMARLANKNHNPSDIQQVVMNDEKGRFSIKEGRIRCNQGHSVKEIELDFEERTPPSTLYHGTSDRFLDSIMRVGILKGNRHHVHLSQYINVAMDVGKRHGGNPIILNINTEMMIRDGYKFYISENGVWLTECVPVVYIEVRYEGDTHCEAIRSPAMQAIMVINNGYYY